MRSFFRKKPEFRSPAPGEHGMTPLHHAAYLGDPEAVRNALPQTADVNERDASGFSALHWLCRMYGGAERIEAARALLERGADLEARDLGAATPLRTACELGSDDLALFLIEAGADVLTRDAQGVTPLMAAAGQGRAAVVAALLARGADLHARSAHGSTALDSARLNEHDEVVRLLEEYRS